MEDDFLNSGFLMPLRVLDRVSVIRGVGSNRFYYRDRYWCLPPECFPDASVDCAEWWSTWMC